MPTPFTAKQGQYLAFIYYYSKIHGILFERARALLLAGATSDDLR